MFLSDSLDIEPTFSLQLSSLNKTLNIKIAGHNEFLKRVSGKFTPAIMVKRYQSICHAALSAYIKLDGMC